MQGESVPFRLAASHAWDVTPSEAIAIQRDLSSRVVEQGDLSRARSVVGIDLGFRRTPEGAELGKAAAVWLDLPSLRVRRHVLAEHPVTFPYVPGLLAFREAPAALAALETFGELPDVLVVDGHGRAHQRRFGIACHLGVILDIATIGCAKSPLVGRHEPVGPEVGDRQPLVDRGEIVGLALRSKPNVKPLYVSIGHRVGLDQATEFVLSCVRKHRLPEPTRLADALASRGIVPVSAESASQERLL